MLVVGASSGVGRAIGLVSARLGADVVFSARREQKLLENVATAGSGHAIAADVQDEQQVERLVAESVEAMGGLDVLVYATGYSGFGMLGDLTAEAWAKVLATNVVGAALVGRYASPHLRSSGGVAFFLSSESVGRPRPGLVHYSSSKIALEETVRGFQTEVQDVRFTLVTIGQTAGTDFSQSFAPGELESVMPRWIAEGHMKMALMDAEDLGEAIVELITTQVRHPGIDLQTAVVRSPGPCIPPGVLPQAPPEDD